MNMSSIITSIKSQLGLYNIVLPFKDAVTGDQIPTETVIHSVIKDTTIPMYSQYQPWIRTGDILVKDLKPVDRPKGIYFLPAFLTTTDVLYIVDVRTAISNVRGSFGDACPVYGINRSGQGVILSMEYMMVANQMRSEPTFEDLGHNKFRLYGFPNMMITIKVACCHEPNGETIEESCRGSFMQLAILDIKEFLYNTLKYYNELPSAFGNTKLNIEDFQTASGDRVQLLKEWDEVFHLDMTDYIKFF